MPQSHNCDKAPVLDARDIHVRLGGREVLRGIRLEVRASQIVGIVGPNGAGKSTLLRALAGLIPPSKGDIELDGKPTSELDRRTLGRRVAYLSQDRVVHWPLTVRAVVALGRLPHRSPLASESRKDRDAIERAMVTMDVAGFAERPVTGLSGGEKARVLIARALAQDATFLIADEPTAGLDPAHALALIDHLTAISRDGHGIVIATHDLSMAARLCDTVHMLKAGEIIAEGRGQEVFTPESMAVGFGVGAAISCVDGVPVVVPSFILTR